GGPLSNLVIGVACLAASSWHNPGPPNTVPPSARAGWGSVALLYPGDPATALLNIAGLVSLQMGLVNLVPGNVGRLRSDGGQLLDLARGRLPAGVFGVVGRDQPSHQCLQQPQQPRREPFGGVAWDAGALRVLLRLEEEAAAVGDDYLGTHHLLLAI